MPKLSDLVTEFKIKLLDTNQKLKGMKDYLDNDPVFKPLDTGLTTDGAFRTYTSQEAQDELGFKVPQPDYMMKVIKDSANPNGYRTSYITPQGWEFDDIKITDPEGNSYTHDEFNQMLDAENQAVTDESWENPTADLTTVPIESVFGKVLPQQDIDQIINYAKTDSEGFVTQLRQTGKTEDTVALLKQMMPNITDSELDQILVPEPEGLSYVPGTSVLAMTSTNPPIQKPEVSLQDVIDPSKLELLSTPEGRGMARNAPVSTELPDYNQTIKTGVPNYQRFFQDYIKSKGWDMAMPSMSLVGFERDQAERDFSAKLDEVKAEYIKLYGNANQVKSGVSAITKLVLPATGKLIDPEKPDVMVTDVIFDVATLVPGVGYISKAGNLVKNAALASKLTTIANTTSAGLFTAGIGTNLAQNWDSMTSAERVTNFGMMGLTAIGAGIGVKSLLTPQVKSAIATTAKAIGADAKRIALEPQPGAISFGGGVGKSEDDFAKLVKGLSNEERLAVSAEIENNITTLSNKLSGGSEKSVLSDILKTDSVYNKPITAGANHKTTLGNYLGLRYGKAGELPETFSKVEANTIAGYSPDHVWDAKFLNKEGRVKPEYFFDRVAEETSMSGKSFDEIKEHLNDLFIKRAELKKTGVAVEELSAELDGAIRQQEILNQDVKMSQGTSVQTDMFGKPAQSKMLEESNTAVGQGGVKEPLITPETPSKPLAGQEPLAGMGEPPKPPKEPPTDLVPRPEEPNWNESNWHEDKNGKWVPPESKGEQFKLGSGKTLTKNQIDHELNRISYLLTSDDVQMQRQVAMEFRAQERAQRATNYQALAEKYVIEDGLTFEQAMAKARTDAMSGKYSDLETDVFQNMTDQVRDVLFAKVYSHFKGDAFKQMQATTALTHWLQGKSLPDIPGIKGGSAKSILMEVFTDQPKLFKALEKAAEEKKPLRDVVEGKFYETGKDPVPLDKATQDYLRSLSNTPYGTAELSELAPKQGAAIWKSKDGDTPVNVTGLAGEKDGIKYYNIEGTNTAIPETELEFKTILQSSDTRTSQELILAKQALKAKYDLAMAKLSKHEDMPPFEEWDQDTLHLYIQAGQEKLGSTPPVIKLSFKDTRTKAQIETDLQTFATELAPDTPKLDFIDIPADKKVLQKLLPNEYLQNVPKQQQWIVYRALKEAGATAVDIGNFLRANVASGDFSFWRQQSPLIAGNLKEFLPANISAWKSMWSKAASEASWQRITLSKEYPLYTKILEKYKKGDFLRPLHLEKGTARWKGVEEFGFTQGSNRPIPKLTAKLPWVKVSERGFVTGANEHNWGIFQKYYKALTKQAEMIASGRVKLKPGEVFDIEQELGKLADGLANFTGRGYLGHTGNIAPVANSLFFSMRLNLGRVLSVANLFSSNKTLRNFAWKNAMAFVGTITAVEMLGEKMGIWDVEKDSNNSDFMRIRIGNTRLDPWGGYQPFVVFVSRFISGKGESSLTGQEYTVDKQGAVSNLVRSKFSPGAGLIADFATGENFIGEPLDIKDPQQWAQRIVPFAWMDIQQAMADNFDTGAAIAIPTLLGAGTQTYSNDFEAAEDQLGYPKYPDNLPYGITEPIDDVKDYFADIAPEVRGVDIAELTDKKGFSDKVRSVASLLPILDNLKELPTEKLTNINADPAKNDGKTYRIYWRMWQDRLKIVASGDEEALKAFDNDDRTRDAKMGNFSKTELLLLDEYYSLSKDKQKEFLKLYPELNQDKGQQYYIDHPKENGLAAIWGQAKVYTQAAYNEAQRLIKELDIPDSAIKEYLPPKDVATDSFKYQDAVSEFGANSAEARLIRAESPDNKLTKWMQTSNSDLQDVDTPIPILKIDIANRDVNEKYKSFDDLPSVPNENDPNYKNGKEYARKQYRLTPDGVRYLQGVDAKTAYSNGADEATAKLWVKHGDLQDQTSYQSADVKLWFIDNPETYRWALTSQDGRKPLLSDDGGLPDGDPMISQGRNSAVWNVPVLRLDVQFRDQDKVYDAIKDPDKGIQLQKRFAWLDKPENKDYKASIYTRKALKAGMTDQTLIDEYVEFNNMPRYGAWRDRYLGIDHPELWDEITRLQILNDDDTVTARPNPSLIPSLLSDQIYESNKAKFKAFEDIKKMPITEDERKEQRRLMFLKDQNFKNAYLAYECTHDWLIEDKFIADYVNYYNIPVSGYAQERFLKTHPEFYQTIKIKKEWEEDLEARDPKTGFSTFDEVPTEDVEKYWNVYQKLPSEGKQKDAYRQLHPDLDAWMVKYKGYTPLGHVHRLSEESKLILSLSETQDKLKNLKELAGVK